MRGYTQIEVDIDDYLDDASDTALIEETMKRLKIVKTKAGQEFKEALDEYIKNEKELSLWPVIETIKDMQRQQWVIDNWERIQP